MALRTWNIASLGRRYLLSSLMYLGLAIMMISLIQPESVALGECDAKNGCESGMKCCEGVCIPEDYLCCEDGTSGPSDNCVCCSTCSACGIATIACPEE